MRRLLLCMAMVLCFGDGVRADEAGDASLDLVPDILLPEQRAWLDSLDRPLVLTFDPRWFPENQAEVSATYAGLDADFVALLEKKDRQAPQVFREKKDFKDHLELLVIKVKLDYLVQLVIKALLDHLEKKVLKVQKVNLEKKVNKVSKDLLVQRD